jgi:hypothetical protein
MEIPEKCAKIMRTTVLAVLMALLSMSAAAADKQTQWEAHNRAGGTQTRSSTLAAAGAIHRRAYAKESTPADDSM